MPHTVSKESLLVAVKRLGYRLLPTAPLLSTVASFFKSSRLSASDQSFDNWLPQPTATVFGPPLLLSGPPTPNSITCLLSITWWLSVAQVNLFSYTWWLLASVLKTETKISFVFNANWVRSFRFARALSRQPSASCLSPFAFCPLPFAFCHSFSSHTSTFSISFGSFVPSRCRASAAVAMYVGARFSASRDFIPSSDLFCSISRQPE